MRLLKAMAAMAGLGVALAYLTNPGAGAAELLADDLRLLGHLDEIAAVTLLASAFRTLRLLVHAGGDDDGPGGRLVPVPVRRRR